MTPPHYHIALLSAPSILGIRPTGVEEMAAALLGEGLANQLHCRIPIKHIPTLNEEYNGSRDPETQCLNPSTLHRFSQTLNTEIMKSITQHHFPVVLGGDCSILLGIMPALKAKGAYGIVFIDAHADFYEPGRSVTGEVADMDLAIITGRGPELLTDIEGKKPYVQDENVIHIGQRDWEETQKYGSQDIGDTSIKRFDLSCIRQQGIAAVTGQVLQYVTGRPMDGIWIHFDTDALSDDINPAVDYRLPGGLEPGEVSSLLRRLLQTGKIAGISVTCFNPKLDKHGAIARIITGLLGEAFRGMLL